MFVILIVLVVLAVLVAGLYNSLVALRNRAAGAWSDIDVQLQRRHDLVGNLVETVKGYASHERQTLEQVIEARNRAVGATSGGSPREAGLAENALTAQLRTIFALAEAYPDLKANASFQQLQARISELETAIADRRELYNEAVNVNNASIEQFPASIIAGMFSFRPAKLLEFADAEKADVSVKALFNG